MGRLSILIVLAGACIWAGLISGCRSTQQHRKEADQAAKSIIDEKQKQALKKTEPFTIETPADTLRKRLLLDQNLPTSGPGSLGAKDLKPTDHWPKDPYLQEKGVPTTQTAEYEGGTLRLGLMEALQVAAQNSREYQSRKESIFQDALSLELQRDDFRASFAAVINNRATYDLGGNDPVSGVTTSPEMGVTQRLKGGGAITANLAFDLAKLLTQTKEFSRGIAADASISIPLLAGAGKYIVMEQLTQAERNVAYDLLEFEQYKRQFAVSIASSYLSVLQRLDAIDNQSDAYRRIILSTARSKRLAEAGRLRPLEYDQALQQELSARDSWISARQAYRREIDAFKVLLGLPPDADVELDRGELKRLAAVTEKTLRIERPTTQVAAVEPTTQATTQPATVSTSQPSMSEVVLEEPTMEGAGPYELPPEEAVKLALENRPDLKVTQGEVYDAQRRVVIAANSLQMGITLTASGSAGGRRSGTGATAPDADLRVDKGSYAAGARFELPLERTAEQNAYRSSLINLERAARAVQEFEDSIKQSVRNQLRSMLQSRESLKTQATAVAVAERRVRSTQMLLDAGRAAMRDVLDAQASLVDAQNRLTSALVTYRVAELQLQRDVGLLQVNHEGLWREYFSPVRNDVQ